MKKTNQDYHIHAYGYDLLVPSGTVTTNSTALGVDERYNFVNRPEDITYKDSETRQYKNVSSRDNYPLYHDLFYYGINVPSDYISLH